MKLRTVFFAVLMLSIISGITTAQDDAEPASATAKWSESQMFSYILGTQIGTYSKENEMDVDVELFARGLADMIKGGELVVSDSEINIFMASQQKKKKEKAQAEMMANGNENTRKGLAFLGANKKKPGVKETASGLQYKVITMGEGAKPEATDKVKVHYSATLIDGKEFDSSYKRDQPAEFGLNQVIKGWTEGLQLMNVGSKYVFYIPSGLAYGPNGPAAIGPNQTLIFTVELLDIIAP
ncbi:MAG: FKBP-type peptidyl-prolyl cis-trans isomerase [Candidatus Scalindua sp.]|nr:FKBP-type peptidyl-prolyl cis-trans isomerase [Candidatus Scalindua sp.]